MKACLVSFVLLFATPLRAQAPKPSGVSVELGIASATLRQRHREPQHRRNRCWGSLVIASAPGRTRTSDQQLRRLLLYPPELRARRYCSTT